MSSVVEVTVWWLTLTGLWVVTQSSAPTGELIAAVASALVCAIAATAGRRATGTALRPSAAWLRWLPTMFGAIAVETPQVLAMSLGRLVGRPPKGRFRSVFLRVPPGTPPARRTAHRAFATVVLSSSPGSCVIDTSTERDELLVHELGVGGPALDQRVAQ